MKGLFGGLAVSILLLVLAGFFGPIGCAAQGIRQAAFDSEEIGEGVGDPGGERPDVKPEVNSPFSSGAGLSAFRSQKHHGYGGISPAFQGTIGGEEYQMIGLSVAVESSDRNRGRGQ